MQAQSTVSLVDLLVGMNWTLARIDQEMKQGNIIPVRRSGALRFKMNVEHERQVIRFREPAQQIAAHINRKSA